MGDVRCDYSTYHSCGRVNDFHLLENGGSIIGDKDFSSGVLDLHS